MNNTATTASNAATALRGLSRTLRTRGGSFTERERVTESSSSLETLARACATRFPTSIRPASSSPLAARQTAEHSRNSSTCRGETSSHAAKLDASASPSSRLISQFTASSAMRSSVVMCVDATTILLDLFRPARVPASGHGAREIFLDGVHGNPELLRNLWIGKSIAFAQHKDRSIQRRQLLEKQFDLFRVGRTLA